MRLSNARSGLLLGLDIIGLIFCYNIAHKIRLDSWIGFASTYLWLLIIAAVLTLYIMDVYRFDNSRTMEQLPVDTFLVVYQDFLIEDVLLACQKFL